MISRTVAGLAALVLALPLTGCMTPSSAGPETIEEPAAEVDELPADCLTPTPGALAALTGSIIETVPNAEILRTGVVASDESDSWMVAVEFHDPGLDREFTGIWASIHDITTQDDAAFVAVDEVAEASATYLQPKDFDGIGAQLPAAERAVACLA